MEKQIVIIDYFNYEDGFMIDWETDYDNNKTFLNIQIVVNHNKIKLNDFSIAFAIDLIDKTGNARNLYNDSEFDDWDVVIKKLNGHLNGWINEKYFPNNIEIQMSLKQFLDKIGM